jgi:predicted RND superfamily exporter protein
MPVRRVLAVLLVAASLIAAWQVRRVSVDNRLERWLGEGGEGAAVYEQFRRDFGSDEFLLAVVGGGFFFTPDTLELLLSCAESLEAVPGVVEVRGIPILYRDLFGAEDPEALAEEMTSTPFYRGLFISADGELAGLLLEIDPADEPAARRRIVHAVREAVLPLRESGREVRLVGSTALIVALDEVSAREARRTIPIALAGSLLMLALMLRSARAMVATAASALLAVLLTLGLAVAAGISFNMVSTALPPLLWVLALSNSIHIMRRYQDLRIDDTQERALAQALAETTRPCILAAVTTAAGFASLTVSVMAPVRELGWLAALGILLALAINLTVTPLLVELLRVPAFRRHLGTIGGSWGWGWRRHPRVILAIVTVLVLAAAASVPAIRVESDPVAFLPENHSTTQDFRSLDGRLGGFHTLEVLLVAPGPWYAPGSWPVLERVTNRLAASPIVTRVLSPVDVLAKLNHWQGGFEPGSYRPPETREDAADVIAAAGDEGRRALSRLVLADGRTVRLSALVNETGEERFLELVDEAWRALEELPVGWTARVTGQVLLLVEAQQALVATQLESLGLALLLVFATIAAGLGSWRLTATAVPPNLIPILAAFAAMAVLRLPLDAGTVMVASIALGIAVDNTVHVLENVRRRLADGAPVADATAATLRTIGPALAATTATAAAGFLALATSEFVPIRDFGILATVAMMAALAADVLVLPSILMVTGRRR